MPHTARKPCASPGCVAITASRWCDDHRREEGRRYDSGRPSAARRGYGARWRRLRLMVLRRQPLCADPFGVHELAGEVVAATEVDHVVAKKAGGTDTVENLQALCKTCHSKKTAVKDGRWEGA